MDKKENAPIVLKFGQEKLPLPFDRTAVYTYLGATAMSHLWIERGQNGENREGYRIFYDQFGNDEETRREHFGNVMQAMLNYGYEMHLNIKQPHPMDVDAYIDFTLRDIDTEEAA